MLKDGATEVLKHQGTCTVELLKQQPKDAHSTLEMPAKAPRQATRFDAGIAADEAVQSRPATEVNSSAKNNTNSTMCFAMAANANVAAITATGGSCLDGNRRQF